MCGRDGAKMPRQQIYDMLFGKVYDCLIAKAERKGRTRDEVDEQFFSFVVKTDFDTKHRYDQSGIVMYLDSDNWLKAASEYENEQIQRLGSVVTNNGYSDWSSMDIDASIKSMWFRFSRRENDFCIENSFDGVNYKQMRICHMFNAKKTISFGIFACSAEDSSFEASFTNMEITECKWLAHDGQAPDEEI